MRAFLFSYSGLRWGYVSGIAIALCLKQVTPDPIGLDQPHKSLRTESVGIQCLFLIPNLSLVHLFKRAQIMRFIAQSDLHDLAGDDVKTIDDLTIKFNRSIHNPSMQSWQRIEITQQ